MRRKAKRRITWSQRMSARHVGTPKIRSLYSVLWRWTGLLRTTARGWVAEDDCMWWYTERALVGTLAAASWLNGGQALEEYSNRKGRDANKYEGRCDLYLDTGSSEFVAEAKLHWCNVGVNSRTGINGAKKKLRAACDEARMLTGYGARRLGMVFIVPQYPWSQRSQSFQLLSAWQTELMKLRVGALAWSLPLAARDLRVRGYVYPSVAVIVREVGRG